MLRCRVANQSKMGLGALVWRMKMLHTTPVLVLCARSLLLGTATELMGNKKISSHHSDITNVMVAVGRRYLK